MLTKSNQFKRNTKGRVNKEDEKVHDQRNPRMLFLSQKRTLCQILQIYKTELKAKEKTEEKPKQNPDTSESLISEGFDFDKQYENL